MILTVMLVLDIAGPVSNESLEREVKLFMEDSEMVPDLIDFYRVDEYIQGLKGQEEFEEAWNAHIQWGRDEDGS